ncbi:endonuclease III [Patescibacteria group bacterium]
MTKKYTQKILLILKKSYPDAKIALYFGDDFQLLLAVILSAQCTDERVNKVTPKLFEKYPTVVDFANAKVTDIEKLIFSTGFYKNKSKNIKAAAKRIVDTYKGKVPSNMKDLLTLPGVARKTANVILQTAFNKSEGIVVDTHVIRLSGRLGFVSAKLAKSKNAVKIETELIKIIPKKDWGIISMLLILHGRQICKSRKPACEKCALNKLCPSAFKLPK